MRHAELAEKRCSLTAERPAAINILDGACRRGSKLAKLLKYRFRRWKLHSMLDTADRLAGLHRIRHGMRRWIKSAASKGRQPRAPSKSPAPKPLRHIQTTENQADDVTAGTVNPKVSLNPGQKIALVSLRGEQLGIDLEAASYGASAECDVLRTALQDTNQVH